MCGSGKACDDLQWLSSAALFTVSALSRTRSPVPGVSGTRCSGPTCRSWKAVLTSWQLYASTSIAFNANTSADKTQKDPQEFTRGHIPRDIAASHAGYPRGLRTGARVQSVWQCWLETSLKCDEATMSLNIWQTSTPPSLISHIIGWGEWERLKAGWRSWGSRAQMKRVWELKPVCPALHTLQWSTLSACLFPKPCAHSPPFLFTSAECPNYNSNTISLQGLTVSL